MSRVHIEALRAAARVRAQRLALEQGRDEDDSAYWLGADAHVGAALPLPQRRRVRDWLARTQRVLSSRRLVFALGSVLALYGLGGAAYLEAKATLAQALLRGAWSRSVAKGIEVRPWPWADTWPVARLSVPRLGVDQIVLAGAAGRTLAFGPGLSTAAAMPGDEGNTVISGHRDTHFGFLRELRVGDRVWIATPQGRYAYAIQALDVVDARTTRLAGAGEGASLSLVTCYPFDAVVPGGPLRYVASARLVAREAPPTVET